MSIATPLASELHQPRTPGTVVAGPPLVGVLLTLTVVAGLVDATTYLGLGRVFAANMTGNVVLLGFALAGAPDISVSASISSMAAFLVGAAIGGLLLRKLEANRRRWLITTLLLELVGLGIAAACAASSMSQNVIVAVLALAMGLRTATVRRLAVPDLTTTVLTMTLAGLAADPAAGQGSSPASTRRIQAVLAMLLGAGCGALLLRNSLAAPLGFAACLLLLATFVFVLSERWTRT